MVGFVIFYCRFSRDEKEAMKLNVIGKISEMTVRQAQENSKSNVYEMFTESYTRHLTSQVEESNISKTCKKIQDFLNNSEEVTELLKPAKVSHYTRCSVWLIIVIFRIPGFRNKNLQPLNLEKKIVDKSVIS